VGFRASFVVGGVILMTCALTVWCLVPDPPPGEARARRGGGGVRDVLVAAAIILAGSSQIFFLPAILPRIMADLGVAAADTLGMSGFIISASGVAAALGSVVAPRLAEVTSERRLVSVLLVASSVSLVAFALAGSVATYGVLRFVQVLCIAPVFPIVVARIAQHASGQAVGFVNSARIAAAFVGPVIATTLLARGPAAVVYTVLAMMTLACLPLVLHGRRSSRST
jgi:AAHS family benzoate transporter-like MFS transporter